MQSQNDEKRLLVASCLSVRSSVHMKQLGSHWSDFHEIWFDVCLPCVVVIWEEENQLDATQSFIELVICSTCFGHVYAHHQELATILLVWHVACDSWLLVVRRSGTRYQTMRSGWGMLFYSVEQHSSPRWPATSWVHYTTNCNT